MIYVEVITTMLSHNIEPKKTNNYKKCKVQQAKGTNVIGGWYLTQL